MQYIFNTVRFSKQHQQFRINLIIYQLSIKDESTYQTISGDKIQNVLWRVYHMTLPASITSLFTVALIILCITVH